MSLSVEQLTEYLIYGYIREFETNSNDLSIPSDINIVCIRFYGLLIHIESHILTTDEDKSLLINLLSKRFDMTRLNEIKLFYNSKKDGATYKDYKIQCHNKPKTITLIKTKEDYIFGGYTFIPWSDKSGYKQDSNAFLFFLKCNDTNKESKIFNVIKDSEAVYHYDNTFGPWFGSFDVILWMNNMHQCGMRDCGAYQCTSMDLCGHSSDKSTYDLDDVVFEMFQLL